MDDHMLDLTEPGDRIVGRLLQAYGEDVLSPSIAATTRMRMGVMAAAHRRAALLEADATFGAAGQTTAARAVQRARLARNAWRRPVAAVTAGCLTLGILAGTAFAARPGGPLYEARLWTEMANLPAGVVDRTQAEIHRLEQRIEEAQQAATAGDGAGTEAALVAYSRIVMEAAAGTHKDATAKATLEVTVTRHVAVLTTMVATVPPPARDAAEDALVSTTAALDDLGGAGVPPTDGGAATDSTGLPPTDGAGPGAPGTTTSDGDRGGTKEPAKTPKPPKTPEPKKTPEPRKTPKPPGAP